MKPTFKKHRIDGVFVLLLFSVFAACVLLVLLTGAGSYQRLTKRDAKNYDQRICVQYLAAKVRHAEQLDGIFVGNFDGIPAKSGDTLFLTEDVDGETYWTRIYYEDGYVRELYAAADETFEKEDGEPVLAARSLTFQLSADGLLMAATVDLNGDPTELTLSLRCGEGAAT